MILDDLDFITATVVQVRLNNIGPTDLILVLDFSFLSSRPYKATWYFIDSSYKPQALKLIDMLPHGVRIASIENTPENIMFISNNMKGLKLYYGDELLLIYLNRYYRIPALLMAYKESNDIIYTQILQYAYEYNITQILDTCSDDVKRIMKISTQTNHRI